ncbi:DNA polymerase III subunit delta [Candidatus Kuenenbacteria bacterium CG10_big_fil_rev_8_21_14_0_10_36_11]|uniref:DNA polymerase III subunit delta n=1 Tax=Candidatus Kuenenbacteria bacterium CG10_big_fil_rev_8_21_14_0_10_36_11 TaxID=1974618 RepID=A0A2M6WB90_9BACT|nr:MAG: DNA polymerase III subunit delta [Candidatus Kuenenbacteria bacterium CG10_big_fil_rev_8_21_14_0_10_36_11]
MIYFVYGMDNYRAKEKLKELREKYADFEWQKIEGEKISLDELSGRIKSASLLSPKRFIVLENLTLNKAQKEISQFFNGNQSALDNQNDIFVFFENKADKKTSLYKFLSQSKNKFELENLAGAELKKWILNYAQKKGGQIEPQALQEILAGEQSDLQFLALELDKLLAYDKKITAASVNLLTAASFDTNIFNLTDAVGAGDKARALKLLNYQFNSGAEPLYLLSMIIRQFRILIQIKETSLKNNNYNLIAKELDLHPFVVQKTISQIKKYSFEELEHKYAELLQIDLMLKSSKIPAEVVLTKFVME